MNNRRERPRHLRQGERLSNGTVVVTVYDASGQLVRKTYHYSTDEALLRQILEGRSDERRSPNAS